MADDKTKTPEQAPVQDERMRAIRAYYNARSKEERAAIVKQYPFLEQIFSAGNHS